MNTAETHHVALEIGRVTEASARASYAWALHELGDAAGARGAAIDAAAAWLEDGSDLTENELLELLDAVDGDGRALLAMVQLATALAAAVRSPRRRRADQR